MEAEEEALAAASLALSGPDSLSAKFSDINTSGYGTQVSGIDLSINSALEATFVPDVMGEVVYRTEAISGGAVKEDYYYTNKNAFISDANNDFLEFCLADRETVELFLAVTGEDLIKENAMARSEVTVDGVYLA